MNRPNTDAARPSRRQALRAVASGLTVAGLSAAALARPSTPTAAAEVEGSRPVVAMLVHQNVVLLDLVGPQTIFTVAGCDTLLFGKNADPVATDVGLSIAPTYALGHQLPRPANVLFVPGGLTGTIASMGDPDILGFLDRMGATAGYVTSVCTGGLLLAAAGLLRGYRATAHWAVREELATLGAIPSAERVVVDRNRITGAGVTAGMDLALTVVARLLGEHVARRTQLICEYDPQPPFDSGSPAQAEPALVAEVRQRRAGMDAAARRASREAASRLGLPG